MALHQTGRSANSLAKEYNVSTATVTKWVKQADLENTDELSSRERMLIKENQRLKGEIDILKRERCCWQKNNSPKTNSSFKSRCS